MAISKVVKEVADKVKDELVALEVATHQRLHAHGKLWVKDTMYRVEKKMAEELLKLVGDNGSPLFAHWRERAEKVINKEPVVVTLPKEEPAPKPEEPAKMEVATPEEIAELNLPPEGEEEEHKPGDPGVTQL